MITQEHINTYHELNNSGIDLSNLFIIHAIMNNEDMDQITDERLLFVANTALQCYLQDDYNNTIDQIADAVLKNSAMIENESMSPREILRRFL